MPKMTFATLHYHEDFPLDCGHDYPESQPTAEHMPHAPFPTVAEAARRFPRSPGGKNRHSLARRVLDWLRAPCPISLVNLRQQGR